MPVPGSEQIGEWTPGDLSAYLQQQQRQMRAQLPRSGQMQAISVFDHKVQRQLDLGSDSQLMIDGIPGSSGQVLVIGGFGNPTLATSLTGLTLVSPTITGTVAGGASYTAITLTGTVTIAAATLAAGGGVTLTGTWNTQGITIATGTGMTMTGTLTITGMTIDCGGGATMLGTLTIQGMTLAGGTGVACTGTWNMNGTVNLAAASVMQAAGVTLGVGKSWIAGASGAPKAGYPNDMHGFFIGGANGAGNAIAGISDVACVTGGVVMTSQRLNIFLINLPEDQTVTGVMYHVSTAGVTMTLTNVNGVAIYSGVGTATLTRQQQATGVTWTTAGVIKTNFAATVALTAGLYFVCIMASWSAATTVPQLSTINGTALMQVGYGAGTNFPARFGLIATQTAFGATITTNTIVGNNNAHWLGIY